MPIKHIVLSGGGYLGFYELGALQKLFEEKYIHLQDIETIYGVSVGSIIGCILCLTDNINDVVDYAINRPWNKHVKINISQMFEIVDKCGIVNDSLIQIILEPLLKVNELNCESTLLDLYETTKKELHIFSVEMDKFDDGLVDFNYKTHPELSIIEAVYMSCSIPLLFQPKYYNNSYYIDGGIINNYPMDICVKENDEKEVLGIKLQIDHHDSHLPNNSNIFSFGYYLFRKFSNSVRINSKTYSHELLIPCEYASMEETIKLFNTKEKRNEFIELGKKFATAFLSYENNKTNTNISTNEKIEEVLPEINNNISQELQSSV